MRDEIEKNYNKQCHTEVTLSYVDINGFSMLMLFALLLSKMKIKHCFHFTSEFLFHEQHYIINMNWSVLVLQTYSCKPLVGFTSFHEISIVLLFVG